jgi:hypothetical protein
MHFDAKGREKSIQNGRQKTSKIKFQKRRWDRDNIKIGVKLETRLKGLKQRILM